MAQPEQSKTRLQHERESRDLSQTRLAGMARMHPGAISRIESRLVLPSNPQRHRLAEALGDRKSVV